MTNGNTAVHFGAGNIGRGFIGALLSKAGYHVTFIDVQANVIDALNKEQSYTLHILDHKHSQEEITDVSAVKTSDPGAIEAIAHAEILTTAVGPNVLDKIAPTIAKGIAKRRITSNAGDLTIVACENMINATSHLETSVFDSLTEEEDRRYATEHVGFANCEVDRIVPAFDGDDLLDVGVEDFYEWVVEKSKVKNGLQIEGMQLQDNLDPFLERKLYTLNCGHAMLAYLGRVKGYETVADALQDEAIKDITHAALAESGAALVKKHGFDAKAHDEYIERTMARYANPNIHDELSRVGRSPLRKISPKERLVGAISMCVEYDLPRENLLKGVAAALHFEEPEDDEAGKLNGMVSDKGLEFVIEETTKFEKGSKEHSSILKAYEELNSWKKPTN